MENLNPIGTAVWQLSPYSHVVSQNESHILLSHHGQRVVLPYDSVVSDLLVILRDEKTEDQIFDHFSSCSQKVDTLLKSFQEKNIISKKTKNSNSAQVNAITKHADTGSYNLKGLSDIEIIEVVSSSLRTRQREDISFQHSLSTLSSASSRRRIVVFYGADYSELQIYLSSNPDFLKECVLPVIFDDAGFVFGPFLRNQQGRPCISCVKQNYENLFELSPKMSDVPDLEFSDIFQYAGTMAAQACVDFSQNSKQHVLQKDSIVFDLLNCRTEPLQVNARSYCVCTENSEEIGTEL